MFCAARKVLFYFVKQVPQRMYENPLQHSIQLHIRFLSKIHFVFTGNSNVGVSNSVGASSLAIIIALGVPWFFRAVISSEGHERSYVALHTNGMEYIILSLLLLTLCFYLIVYFRRFILTKITGGMLIATYAVFITFAVLMEVGVFFDLICIPYQFYDVLNSIHSFLQIMCCRSKRMHDKLVEKKY